ncbi:MAG TPA: RNA polymerase sigma factor [Actinomycetota bacterium]|nr:RNA polymerase sigma factor [Actinomycetota bacterium]
MRRPNPNRSEAPRELVPTDLVDRCRRGDEIAWKELVELTHREVYTLCLRILHDPSDAAEATQDAYLKAWRGLRGFRGEAQFTTWLYRVASNAAISKHRSRKRRRAYEVGAEDELLSALPASGSVEGTAEVRGDVRAVEAAIRDLPDHYRSAVVLRDVYGLSIEEIAKELKISETAAKVRVHRARKKLKETLYPTGEER